VSAKEEFIQAFKDGVGEHPKYYWDTKEFKQFADILNRNPQLRNLFNEAVNEARSIEDDACYGLGGLFDATR